jgi:hypothetical protein
MDTLERPIPASSGTWLNNASDVPDTELVTLLYNSPAQADPEDAAN